MCLTIFNLVNTELFTFLQYILDAVCNKSITNKP